MSNGSPQTARNRTRVRPALLALVVISVLGFFILGHFRRAKPDTASRPADDETVSTQTRPPWTMGTSDAPAPRSPNVSPKDIPPWEATRKNTPAAGPGYLSAWKVNPRPPVSNVPPAPEPPPDPATNHPPIPKPLR